MRGTFSEASGKSGQVASLAPLEAHTHLYLPRVEWEVLSLSASPPGGWGDVARTVLGTMSHQGVFPPCHLRTEAGSKAGP